MNYFNFKGTINGTEYLIGQVISWILLMIGSISILQGVFGDDPEWLPAWAAFTMLISGFVLAISVEIKRIRAFTPDPWKWFLIFFAVLFVLIVISEEFATTISWLLSFCLVFGDGNKQQEI